MQHLRTRNLPDEGDRSMFVVLHRGMMIKRRYDNIQAIIYWYEQVVWDVIGTSFRGFRKIAKHFNTGKLQHMDLFKYLRFLAEIVPPGISLEDFNETSLDIFGEFCSLDMYMTPPPSKTLITEAALCELEDCTMYKPNVLRKMAYVALHYYC